MTEFFARLFSSDFMPHGHCFFWRPEIVWLHVVSDGVIALAYFMIPVSLVSFVRRRKDLAYRWIFVLFGIFILACGTTHLMAIWTLWHGTYRLEGLIKAITAAASVATAALLIGLVPRALALPSPEQLRRANRALEAEIRERVRAELELQRKAEELARSNAELEQFASVASHDLQEPLRKVQAFGDLLRKEYGPSLDDQARDYVERMAQAAARMRGLVGDLLAFARVRSRAQAFRPVDLPAIAAQVVSDLEPRIRESGGSVDLGPLPRIDAEPTQMAQLFLNLVGNALKFRRPGVPPVVRVRAEVVDDPGGSPACRLTVEDNGVGFDARDAGRIFNMFQRLHRRDEYDGTGMGLAICRKIAEHHGGTIAARSEPGRGSTFEVILPVRQRDRQETP